MIGNTTIPDHATLVHDGLLFKVYQRQQKMFDGSFQLFERIIREDAVTVLPVIDNTIIVVHEVQPTIAWRTIPISGRVERGRDPLDVAHAELAEEAHLKCSSMEKFWTHEYTDRMFYNFHYYIARDCSPHTLGNHDASGEKIQTRALQFNEFIDLCCTGKDIPPFFAAHILRMEREGTLDIFKRQLFG